jgi:pimeloyl-ACP methyl ester carboxylesterase
MAAPLRSGDRNPTLLLLHAAGLDRGSWDAVVRRFPGFTHAIAIDLPGHGGTPGLAYDLEVVPQLADYVAEKITALGLHRPHVVGHSLGGTVALELACRVPVAAVTAFCAIGFCTATHASVVGAKVRALVRLVRAVGPAVRGRLLRHALFRRLVMSGLSARPADIHADDAAADVSSMVGSDLVELTRFARRYAFSAPERLGATPVNLVWADQDRIVPPSAAARARRSLPHAQHMVLLDCGHLVMRDDPDGTAAVIHDCHAHLLRDHQRRAAG